jgi:hypothetical protein
MNVLPLFSESKAKPSRGPAISNFCLTHKYITPGIKSIQIECRKWYKFLRNFCYVPARLLGNKRWRGDAELKIGCLVF